MYELEKNKEIDDLIRITKSNSGISGPELARAHMELGKLVAEKFAFLEPGDTTVVAVLRGGIFFAEGIYFALGCKFQLFDPKKDIYQRPKTKYVILVDSVINTGKTIQGLANDENTYVACCVINEKAVEIFGDRLFTARVSSNSYIGSNVQKQIGSSGPDTTMRLFNEI